MATTYLYRTAGSASTNAKKYTLSWWQKRAGKPTFDGSEERILNNYVDANNQGNLTLKATTGTLYVRDMVSSSNKIDMETTRSFYDTAAWYHFVLRVDTTESTEADRVRIYVNGTQETSFSSATYPALNDDLTFGGASAADQFRIGSHNGGGDYIDGNVTHMHWCDGYSYAPTEFGEVDSTSGIWKIKTSASVSYGNNGFFLKFENNAALGTDSSGNTNTFTMSGNGTQSIDTPSIVYPSWNRKIEDSEDGTWSNANLTCAPNGDGPYIYAPLTWGLTKGKWYSEHMISSGNGYGSIGFAAYEGIGVQFKAGNVEPGGWTPSLAYRCISGGIKMNTSNTSYGSAPGTSDAILGIAWDIDNQKFWVAVNGTYVTYGGGVGDPAAGTYGFDWSGIGGTGQQSWTMIIGDSENTGYGNWKSNFGTGYFSTTAITSEGSNGNGSKFEYDVPTGFYAINSKNINTYG